MKRRGGPRFEPRTQNAQAYRLWRAIESLLNLCAIRHTIRGATLLYIEIRIIDGSVVAIVVDTRAYIFKGFDFHPSTKLGNSLPLTALVSKKSIMIDMPILGFDGCSNNV